MNDIKILYKGIWTAFQGKRDIGSNYVCLLLHNQPEKMDIYEMDSMHGYAGIERAKLIAAAPELYSLVMELSDAKDDDLAIIYSRLIKLQEKAKKLLEKIDFRGM